MIGLCFPRIKASAEGIHFRTIKESSLMVKVPAISGNNLGLPLKDYEDELPFLRIESESRMETARRVQRAAVSFDPQPVAGFDIAARLQHLHLIGGDFCLFLPAISPTNPTVGLVLGDVSGKGISSALLSTTIAYLLPWLRPLDNARAALEALNKDLCERSPSDVFVTLVLAEVEPPSGKVRLWTAGHTPPLHWCAREQCVREATEASSILGAFPDWEGVSEEWILEEGDVLLLYSDGLTETRNLQGEWFNECHVIQILKQYAHATAEEITEALYEARTDWGPLTDDLALIVCKRVTPSESQTKDETTTLVGR